jgi:hypothetical protein
MERTPFVERAVKPVAVVFLTTAVSMALYTLSPQITDSWLRSVVVHVSGPLVFAGIGFGALLVYPLAYFRGAGVLERVAASLFTPGVWVAKEIGRVSEFFTLQESLYYGLSSGVLLAMIGACGLMGFSELLCRGVRRRRGETIKIVTPLPFAAFLFSLGALYVILIWGLGVHWFYIYMEGYSILFL